MTTLITAAKETNGGVVLQRFEFIKVCIRMRRLCLKSQLFLYFVKKKSTYPVTVLYSLLFASSSGRSNAISASYRSVELKQTTTTASTRTSLNKRFNGQNNSCARAL